jgi:hypothetical protein
MVDWWVLIPIVAILAGVFKDWVKVRATQQRLGMSSRDQENELTTLRTQQKELVERVKDLETIVASQTWDVLHDRGLAAADRERKLAATARREIAGPDPDEANRQRVEQLARRLQS